MVSRVFRRFTYVNDSAKTLETLYNLFYKPTNHTLWATKIYSHLSYQRRDARFYVMKPSLLQKIYITFNFNCLHLVVGSCRTNAVFFSLSIIVRRLSQTQALDKQITIVKEMKTLKRHMLYLFPAQHKRPDKNTEFSE